MYFQQDNTRCHTAKLTSTAELIQACCKAWDSLTIEDINKHIDRMTDRVQAVIAANGGNTRY